MSKNYCLSMPYQDTVKVRVKLDRRSKQILSFHSKQIWSLQTQWAVKGKAYTYDLASSHASTVTKFRCNRSPLEKAACGRVGPVKTPRLPDSSPCVLVSKRCSPTTHHYRWHAQLDEGLAELAGRIVRGARAIRHPARTGCKGTGFISAKLQWELWSFRPSWCSLYQNHRVNCTAHQS